MSIQDLPSHIRSVLVDQLHYSDLSEIQQLVVKHFKSDQASNNMIAKSKNGTGKSLALTLCVVNLLNQLSEENPENDDSVDVVYPSALLLAPSREIAMQLQEYFSLITGSESQFESMLAIGGLELKD